MGQSSAKYEQRQFAELIIFAPPHSILTYRTQTDQIFIKSSQKDFVILKNMAAIQIDSDTIYLTGGINADYSKISNGFWLYSIKSNYFEKLPCMINERYTHLLQYNKYTSSLYALGGRTYGKGEEGIRAECERYNLTKKVWEPMANMNYKRATFFSVIFQKNLYVFGGYTGLKRRTRKIEMYDEANNSWILINFKLTYGVEQGFLYQEDSVIYILGGQWRNGPTNQIQSVDFINQKSTVSQKQLLRPRVLQKGIQVGKFVFQLFGDEMGTVERGMLGQLQLVEQQLQDLGDNKEFCSANAPLILGEQNSIFAYNNYDDFIICLQSEIIKVQTYPNVQVVSTLALKEALYWFMAGCKLEEDNFLLAGGVSTTFKSISKFVFRLSCSCDNKLSLTPLPPMLNARYAFSMIRNKQFVYAIGGRTYGGDDQGIMPLCERFNLESNVWEAIPPLNERRCSAGVFSHKDYIFVAGGYTTYQQRLKSIECFDSWRNQWQLIGVQLQAPLEAFAIHYIPNQNSLDLITFGGRSKFDSEQVLRYHLDFDMNLDLQNNHEVCQPIPFRCSLAHKLMVNQDTLMLIHRDEKEIKVCAYNFKTMAVKLNQKADSILNLLQQNESKFKELNRMLIFQ